MRELLLFVSCAALFVFFAAHLGLLGILFHAAGRSIVPCFRKPRIAPRAQGGSRQHAGLNGSLTLEQLNVSGTTWGLADTWVQPFTLGWHLKRADIEVGDAWVTPTGRYSPGARSNIGSGYFGNHVIMGATVYLTKNKGTSASIFTDWEVHGQKQGTNGTYKTPGQAFTDEWGVGQILPLSKNLSKLLQVGVIGYDQWQITNNGGTFALTGPLGNTLILPANTLPYYSVHAVGGQANYIMPARNLALFFKYEHEYSSYSATLGNTIVFGGSWTLRIPEHTPTNK